MEIDISNAKGNFWYEETVANIWDIYDIFCVALQEMITKQKTVGQSSR